MEEGKACQHTSTTDSPYPKEKRGVEARSTLTSPGAVRNKCCSSTSSPATAGWLGWMADASSRRFCPPTGLVHIEDMARGSSTGSIPSSGNVFVFILVLFSLCAPSAPLSASLFDSSVPDEDGGSARNTLSCRPDSLRAKNTGGARDLMSCAWTWTFFPLQKITSRKFPKENDSVLLRKQRKHITGFEDILASPALRIVQEHPRKRAYHSLLSATPPGKSSLYCTLVGEKKPSVWMMSSSARSEVPLCAANTSLYLFKK